MRIIFDLRSVGLGNNGGSSTLVKSGNTLVELGHEVFFIDGGKNMHTWTPLIARHKIVKHKSQLPDADFIIATGYRSAPLTMAAPYTAGIKCHWVRGWETWQYNEHDIINKVLKNSSIKLVNGVGLQEKLKQYGVTSHLIRPGYDFDILSPLNLRGKSNIITIGGLNKQGKHENTKRTSWLFETATMLKRKYGDKIKFWMFGMDKLPSTTVVDNYTRNPSVQKKNEIYNNIDIWMAPSKLEGLHMPPAEAMITGCPVVGTNAELSGMKDYLVHNETGIVSENNLPSFISCVEKLILNEDLRNTLGKNAREKVLNIGDRKKNMQILIDFFKNFKGIK